MWFVISIFFTILIIFVTIKFYYNINEILIILSWILFAINIITCGVYLISYPNNSTFYADHYLNYQGCEDLEVNNLDLSPRERVCLEHLDYLNNAPEDYYPNRFITWPFYHIISKKIEENLEGTDRDPNAAT